MNNRNLYFVNILVTTKVSLKTKTVKIWSIYFPLMHSFIIQTLFRKTVGFLCDLVWHRYFSTHCVHLAWLLRKNKPRMCMNAGSRDFNDIMKMHTCITQGYNIAYIAHIINITLQRVIIWRKENTYKNWFTKHTENNYYIISLAYTSSLSMSVYLVINSPSPLMAWLTTERHCWVLIITT